MYLQGQASRPSAAVTALPTVAPRRGAEEGFALAAMLVAIAVMSVMLMVALPTWRHQAQREKEAELVFRGEQYARAIGLYRRKLAGAYPPSLDILVAQKFLRKKYKDPITGEDFVPVFANSAEALGVTATTTTPSTASTAPPGSAESRMRVQIEASRNRSQLAGGAGGIVGVRSKSDAESIRLYKGRSQYNQWIFTYVPPPEQAAPTANPAGGRGPQPTPGFPQRGRGRGGF